MKKVLLILVFYAITFQISFFDVRKFEYLFFNISNIALFILFAACGFFIEWNLAVKLMHKKRNNLKVKS